MQIDTLSLLIYWQCLAKWTIQIINKKSREFPGSRKISRKKSRISGNAIWERDWEPYIYTANITFQVLIRTLFTCSEEEFSVAISSDCFRCIIFLWYYFFMFPAIGPQYHSSFQELILYSKYIWSRCYNVSDRK